MEMHITVSAFQHFSRHSDQQNKIRKRNNKALKRKEKIAFRLYECQYKKSK